jgi:hypothetical protein
MIADKPREKWRYILKKMCKIGVVDHEYIRHTCDMSWVTEEYLMNETERYTRRYSNRKVNTDTGTSISSIGYESVVSMSQKTQSEHSVASSVKTDQQLADQLKKLDEERTKFQEERKKFQEEQASLLLAQQLQFEEQRKTIQEEQNKALEAQQNALLEKFIQTIGTMNDKTPEPLVIDPRLDTDVLPGSITNNRTSRENATDIETLRRREKSRTSLAGMSVEDFAAMNASAPGPNGNNNTVPLPIPDPKVPPPKPSRNPAKDNNNNDDNKTRRELLAQKKLTVNRPDQVLFVDTTSPLLRNGPPVQVMTKEVDFPKSSYLSDLAILPVINFIDAYHSYRSGKAAPQMIVQCMLQEVKTVLISSSVAKTWGLRSVHELDAWKSTDVITLIQEYVTPNSKQDF